MGENLMDAHVRMFMVNAAVNLKKAVAVDDPALTWAVISNLHNVIGSFEEKALEDMKEKLHPSGKPRIRKANK